MRFGLYVSIGILVSGIVTCIIGASMFTVGSYSWEIPGQIVHRCGMFVFFAGLIGLLASVSRSKEMPRDTLQTGAPHASFERWGDSSSPSLSILARAALGTVLFVGVLGTLVGLSQLIMWMGQ